MTTVTTNTIITNNMRYLLSILVLGAFLVSCDKHEHGGDNHLYSDNYDCSDTIPTYEDVKIIFNTSCATTGCHNASSAKHGIKLDTKDNVVKNFEEHSMLCVINHGEDCEPMPIGAPKLSDEEIKIITCWMNHGFK